MRWLVTGARGLLGTDLVAHLRGRAGEQVVPLGRDGLDIRRAADVAAALDRHRPDVLVNCAAWTRVDDAETHEADALAINGHAVRVLAEACAERAVRLVHLSTDYVFDGTAREPYPEDAPPRPLGAYGRGKLAGERAALDHGHVVVRTAWLYGAHGGNFVRTMLRRALAGDTVAVVADQVGQPTWAADLAARIAGLVRAGAPPGIYHGTNAGHTTWYGFAREIFAAAGADPARVTPATTAELARPAPRPAYGVLGHAGWARAGLPPMRHWRAAFRDAWPRLAGAAGGRDGARRDAVPAGGGRPAGGAQ